MKANNLIAILIAVLLMVTGTILGIVNQQMASSKSATATVDALAQIALIHEGIGVTGTDSDDKSELEIIRDSIDWSDAPTPTPVLIRTDDYDVYMNASKDYLLYVYDKLGYTGDKIESGETTSIPPLLVVSISRNWAEGETIQFEKGLFYRVLLPLVLFENEALLREREELLALLKVRRDGALTDEQSNKLNKLAYSYRVIEEENPEPLNEEQINKLLIRVDMVSPSLALAQAALESGYDSSRFAHEGRTLFGQWDWSSDAINPQQQRKGSGNYGVRVFKQPIGSVRSYIWKVNTQRRYTDFREARALQRGNKHGRIVLDGLKLAATMTRYSEQGPEYIKEIEQTIELNHLDKIDHLRLMNGEPIYFD
jgi:Bax protein